MQLSGDRRDLADIATFVAIAEEGSFTRAARRLGRSATILSRRLKSLEERLGVRLIERTTRTAVLTEAGHSYLERLRPALQALDEADREATSYSEGKPRGHLRLALPGSFGRLWVAPMFADFLTTYPDITIEAEFTDRLVDLVEERFDLAIRVGVLADSRLIARKVAVRRRLICASPAYVAQAGAPTDPESLKNHACLRYSGGANPQIWEMADRDGNVARVRVSGPFISDDTYTLLAVANAGLGIVRATDWLLGPELAAGRLVQVLPDWTSVDEGAIHVVMPSTTGAPTKTRAFANWIVERLRRRPPWDEPAAAPALLQAAAR
jgi:DNA-binding transcriptional LysR family regulator